MSWNRTRRYGLRLALLGILMISGSSLAAERKSIVLIAGEKSHGPEGNRIHDYPWTIRLLKTMLEHSNIRDQVDVRLYFNGWPSDATILETADTVMIVSDGRDGDMGREAPHLAAPERIQAIDRLVQRGGGIVTFHFSTFAPDRLADRVLAWYGGYFDWETDGTRQWYSNIKTLEARVEPASENHPVLRGVDPFRMREEFYYDIRFLPNDPGWRPLWRVPDLPATHAQGDVVSWAVERADGGRGFATTCGHFYDNWKEEAFRTTILNALAWTARLEVPAGGVKSPFFDRRAVAEHLGQPELVPAKIDTADETVYAAEPYWYKPGHPLDPAEAAQIETLPGFTAERVLTVPREFGSWTALTVDARGRFVTAAQHRPGLFRVTVSREGSSATVETKVEPLPGEAATIGYSHGLLYAFDSLYVTVSEKNDRHVPGVYRLRDTDGDDQYDSLKRLIVFDASGEHGPHNIVVGPDGRSLYMIGGNGTKLPVGVDRRLPVPSEGKDHLLPPGFESSRHTVGGWVCRFDPEGEHWTLIASGLRNSFDLAFNRQGDLFTFDSDMEWDLGAPWYRPTRICHVVSGAEFGWRGDAAKWPPHFEDNVPAVVEIGPASPTGLTFGYGARFPQRYQEALFACDWTFATIHAVHLVHEGASYRAEVEEFIGGKGLPVTDAVIGSDGALYFTVGGRRLGSALYRVRYTGLDSVEPVISPAPRDTDLPEATVLRRSLESRHGRQDARTVDAVWPYLGHSDRFIRFAARVAVESQPVSEWRARALAAKERREQLSAWLALSRQGNRQDQAEILDRVHGMDWSAMSKAERLTLLRITELALARGEFVDANDPVLRATRRYLETRFPESDATVNRELSRLLGFLGATTLVEPALALMESDRGHRPPLGSGYFTRNVKYGEAVRDMLESAPRVDAMHYAQMLLWLEEGWTPETRRRYFQAMADAMGQSKGGHGYREIWNRIWEAALDRVPESEWETYETLRAASLTPEFGVDLPSPQGPGREWTLEEALSVWGDGSAKRDWQNGRRMFAAAGCALCHQMQGEGGGIGPDLTTLGQRFTVRDMLDAIIHPSNAVSDQYRVTVLDLVDASTVSGRILSRDDKTTRIIANLLRPTQSMEVANDRIRSMRSTPVSTMPSGLIDPLNPDELLDLLAFLVSGGSEVPSPSRDD